MANPRFVNSGAIGSNTAEPVPLAVSSVVGSGIANQQFQLGDVRYGADNTQWAYGQASGAVATGTCTYNATTFLITDAAGNHTADTALADGQAGWVRLTAGATA